MEVYNVYILDSEYDDPRYAGFALNYTENPFVPNLPAHEWSPPRLAGRWQAAGVKGAAEIFNDFPGLSGNPAFSQRAVDNMRDILEPNGELIPFQGSLRTYYAYNITTLIEALDLQRSTIHYFRTNPHKILRISRFEFIPEALAGQSIFRIRQRPQHSLVTDRFLDRVKERKLSGFNFRKIWPLPDDTDWLQSDLIRIRNESQ